MTNRGQHAGDIWRTTSAAKPTLADRFNVIVDMVEFQRFWMYFQRIHIEEMFAVQRHAAEHGVVQCALHHIGILTVAFHFQHSSGKHHQADGGATFSVYRVIRQIVIAAERFTAAL